MSTISQTLSQFGLTANQVKVYLALLELGEAKVQEIAKKARILRTTTYEVLEQLKQIGLISMYHRHDVRLYMAEPPRKLTHILESKQQAVQMALPELESLYNIGDFKPKIRYYEGLEGYKTVYEDSLKAHSKQVSAILSMQDMLDKLGENYMNSYISKRIAAHIALRVIRIESHEIKSIWQALKEELRQVRLAPKNFIFPLTMLVYDNKTAIMSTRRENFGLIIESHEFMQTQKALFEVLWQVSSELK